MKNGPAICPLSLPTYRPAGLFNCSQVDRRVLALPPACPFLKRIRTQPRSGTQIVQLARGAFLQLETGDGLSTTGGNRHQRIRSVH
jgi:hypothetical protein